MNLYGYPQVTGDLDIILELSNTEIRKFIAAVKRLGMIPRLPVALEDFARDDLRKRWITEKNMQVFSVYNPQE